MAYNSYSDLIIRLKSIRSRVDSCSTPGYQYLPMEDPIREEAQFYEDYVKSVELEFGKCSNEFSVFKRLHQDCKEQRITVQEIEWRVRKLFWDHHQKLLFKFCNTVLPYLYPLATKDEVDRANQFMHSVESAFPKNHYSCHLAKCYILKFQDGKLTLEEMTLRMLELLENRDELIKAYIKFVPQSENIISIKRSFPTAPVKGESQAYVHPAIIAILMAFGIGLYKMRK